MGSIRLFLALAVLISHATACDIAIIPGHVAVQAFFMISGFYMSLIIDRKYLKSSLLVFYTNRLLRLFPTYFVVLLVSLVALWTLDVGVGVCTSWDSFKQVFTHGVFTAVWYTWTNIAVLGQETMFLLGIDPSNYSFFWAPNATASAKAWRYVLVPQAWSLSLELYFYLLVPFLLRLSKYSLGMIFFLSLALRLFIVSKGPEYDDVFLRRFFPAELCLFLVGSFSYFLFDKIKTYPGKYMGTICWVTLLIVFIFYDLIDEKYALTTLALSMFLLTPFIFNLAKDSRIDRFLGNISYPIYMIHFLTVTFFEEYFEEYSLVPLVLVVLVGSVVIYFAIEVPVDGWRQSRIGMSRSPAPLCH